MASFNRILHTTMTDRLSWMDRLLERRNYNMGSNRSDYIFIYYCTLRSITTSQRASKRLFNVNNCLDIPLNSNQINTIIEAVDAQKQPRQFTNERIIQKLHITSEEVEILRIGHNLQEKKERAKRKADKDALQNSLKREIIKLYQDGATQKQIEDEFPQISSYAVKKILKPYVQQKRNERTQQIKLLKEHGYTVSDIAQKMKCSRDTVYAALRVEEKSNFTISEVREEKSLVTSFVDERASEIFCLYKLTSKQTTCSPTDMENVRTLMKEQNIAIMGAAGTGKTYMIQQFLNNLTKEELKTTVIAAPTGLAASHVNGTTLHAAFKLSNAIQFDNDIDTAPADLLSMTRIIIDEISMVRIDVFTKVMKTIQLIEKIQNRKIQIIVSGDFGQLSPVVTAQERPLLKEEYPNAKQFYAFESPFWEERKFKKVVLSKIYRQKDAEFCEHLSEIKYGKLSALQWFNDNSALLPRADATYICATNKDVEKYTQDALIDFEEKEQIIFTAKINGDLPSEELPCPKSITIAVGMRVMTVINTARYKNGSIGTVCKICKSSIVVLLDSGNNITISLKRFKLSNGTIYTQLPVIYAFALTVNKAQGCTFDAVNIVGGFFAPGQLYVALSRCRTIENIYLVKKLTEKDLIVDVSALKMTI